MRKYSSRSASRKTLSSQFQSGTIVLMVIITLSFFVLSLFTLFYHNKNATIGYKLKVLRGEREKEMFQIEILDRQIADVSAINKIQDDDETRLDVFEKPEYSTKIIYLKGKTKEQMEKEKQEIEQKKYEEELEKKREAEREQREEQKQNENLENSPQPSVQTEPEQIQKLEPKVLTL